MNSALRRPVPGQLCLLELLAQPNGANGDKGSNMPNDPNSLEPRPVGQGSELGEWERAVLRFAAQHHLVGTYAERVEQHLGCSATRYLQALAGMLDRPEVLAVEPELIGQLRALRDRRQRLRALGRDDT